MSGPGSPWQKSTVGAVCDRPYFVDYKKDARSQTAPTVQRARARKRTHILMMGDLEVIE